MTQMVENLPPVWKTGVLSLGQEGPLENEMATHSSILAWRIPWTEEPGGLQSMASQRVGWATNTFTFSFIYSSPCKWHDFLVFSQSYFAVYMHHFLFIHSLVHAHCVSSLGPCLGYCLRTPVVHAWVHKF